MDEPPKDQTSQVSQSRMISTECFLEEIRSLPKVLALQRLQEAYLSDPRSEIQEKAHNPAGMSNLYYSILTGES